MSSLKSRDGEVTVDHRASPGLPPDFYKPLGIDVPAVGEGQVQSMATYTCIHCRWGVIPNPQRKRERPYCPKCDGYICDPCDFRRSQPGYSHTPFDKIVEAVVTEQPNATLLLSTLKGP